MAIKIILGLFIVIALFLLKSLVSHSLTLNCTPSDLYSYKIVDLLILSVQAAIALFVAYYIPKKLQVSDKLYANLINDLENLQRAVVAVESLVEVYNISANNPQSQQTAFQKINRFFKQTTQTIEAINQRAILLKSSNEKKLLEKLSILRNQITGNQFGSQGYQININKSRRLLDDLINEIETSKLIIFQKIS